MSDIGHSCVASLIDEMVDLVAERFRTDLDALFQAAPVPPRAVHHFTTGEAAAYCRIATSTLRNLLAQGRGPRVRKNGRLNAFMVADLDAWMDARLSAASGQTPSDG